LEMAPALSSSTLYEITFKNLENLAWSMWSHKYFLFGFEEKMSW
jgi:hypothetical protein